VIWEVTPSEPVSQVDFFVDGRKRWTEMKAPYVFNDDDQFLEPWLLSPGEHVLSAKAADAAGQTAEVRSRVTVSAPGVQHAGLDGAFARTVLQSDIERTAHTPGRDANATLPPGRWRMRLHDGLLTFDDPAGSGGGEAFSATARQIRMWGWPQWLLPQNRRGEFCEHEQPDNFTWTLTPKGLVISGGGSCADRDALFVGTWRRQG
jgi:hypothetical protein